MGQDVVIKDLMSVGDVIVIDTDRSFTGQDGETSTPGSPADGVPGLLSERLFDLGLGIDHVFVQQNTVTVRRPGGWDDDATEMVAEETMTFLRFYDEEE
jgi:hypothetical protein